MQSGSTDDLHDGNVIELAVAHSAIARDIAVAKWRCTVSYTRFVVRTSNAYRNVCYFMYVGQTNALGPNIQNACCKNVTIGCL
jgi:hypothetical protein